MKELQKVIKNIISDLQNNINNEKDLDYAKTKLFELYTAFADELEEIETSCNKKVDVIGARYSILEAKIDEIENELSKIEKDIYIDENEEEYDLDIICPYCETEFTIDMSEELKNSVICPECNKEIELDWNNEEEHHCCDHNCSGCHLEDIEEDEEDDM